MLWACQCVNSRWWKWHRHETICRRVVSEEISHEGNPTRHSSHAVRVARVYYRRRFASDCASHEATDHIYTVSSERSNRLSEQCTPRTDTNRDNSRVNPHGQLRRRIDSRYRWIHRETCADLVEHNGDSMAVDWLFLDQWQNQSGREDPYHPRQSCRRWSAYSSEKDLRFVWVEGFSVEWR